MIIPVSAYSTDRMFPLQALFHRSKRVGWVQTYDVFPSKLFFGAKQRLAIYIVQQSSQPSPALYATRYNRWHEPFREHLFALMEYTDVTQMSAQHSVPKVHSAIEQSIWKKLSQFSVLETHLTARRVPHTIYFHNAPYYFMRAMDFIPYFWNERDGEKISTHLKPLYLTTALEAAVVAATMNSSLFYWWFLIRSDCRSLNMREIVNFPFNPKEMDKRKIARLCEIAAELMEDYRYHAIRKKTTYKTTGRVVYDEFHPRHSKSIIDKIDRVLAQHYGFTDEELDFIINYDIKYRMGLAKD